MGLLSLLVLALAFCASVVSADEYSVQIGAFRNPTPKFTESAEKVGKLYTTRTPSGITRIQVGRFASKEEAAIAKAALLGAGYADAFVVRKGVAAAKTSTPRERGSKTAPISTRSSRPAPAAAPRGVAEEQDPLAGVPESLRDRVVILDGRLHVVEGDRFTPLDQYEAPRF